MANRDILVDTSIVIDFLRKKDKSKSRLIQLETQYELSVSSITIFELYAGAIDKEKKEDIERTLTGVTTIPFTSEISKKAGEIFLNLKSQNLLIDVKDPFIGATAIFHNLPVYTLNIKHFKRIPNIKVAK